MSETDSPLTDAQRAEIRERCEAATEGPWRGGTYGGIVLAGRGYGGICKTESKHGMYQNHIANEALIAHSRTDIPALLTTVEHWKARAEKAEKGLELTGDGVPVVDGESYWRFFCGSVESHEAVMAANTGDYYDPGVVDWSHYYSTPELAKANPHES